jgi:ribonucleoside-diphosphate reductase alpha chain
MYFYAWKKGLKTTYYLRSRPATRIAKATVETEAEPSSGQRDPREGSGGDTAPAPPDVANIDAADALACSLENPEICEACQ